MSSFRLRILSAVSASLALIAFSSPAFACWDGYAATVGKVTIYQAGPADWDPSLARDIAAWASRIDGMLPADATLASEHGFVELSVPGRDDAEGRWQDGRMESLYRIAAKLAHLGVATGRARAATPIARPYTVQVFAAHSREGADAFAARFDEALDARKDTTTDLVGFYDAGGYPARHALTHVIAEKDAGGRTIYRVVVGAFLRADEANGAFAAMHRETNVVGFVRAL